MKLVGLALALRLLTLNADVTTDVELPVETSESSETLEDYINDHLSEEVIEDDEMNEEELLEIINELHAQVDKYVKNQKVNVLIDKILTYIVVMCALLSRFKKLDKSSLTLDQTKAIAEIAAKNFIDAEKKIEDLTKELKDEKDLVGVLTKLVKALSVQVVDMSAKLDQLTKEEDKEA